MERQRLTLPGGDLFHLIGNVLSPAGARGRLTILIYHRVLSEPDPILHDEIDAAAFEGHVALLAAEFNVLPLGEAFERLGRSSLPARAVCITFDDGYSDNERTALPILKRHRLPATFFIASGYSEGGIMFNDAAIEAVRRAAPGNHDLSHLGLGVRSLNGPGSRRALIDALLGTLKYQAVDERQEQVSRLAECLGARLPADLMMRPVQIRHLHDAGMEIGAHTVNHPILAVLDAREAREEIVEGKGRLEEITGAPVTLFAYPNGKPGRDYTPRDVELVRRAGFRAAVSTIPGVARRGADPYQLPRFSPWDRNPRRLGMRMLASCARAGERALV
jgi:peptidoglycan/xylan/chitin deacetylase (PgdA/CDA1 family)